MDRMNVTNQKQSGSELLLHGINAGITAGFVLVLVEMVINAAMGRPFLSPLRLASTLVVGTEALTPLYSPFTAAMTGLFVHFALSAVYGIIFTVLLAYTGQLAAATTERLLIYGSTFGLVLWIVNFLVIAPLLFPQFDRLHLFWHGFIAHTFFFGTILGVYIAAVELDWRLDRR